MRAPRNNGLATTGQSRVKSQFEALEWGTLPNTEHDVGTDLFLMVRDERRYDLGFVLGAQVKTGPSYFRQKERDEDGGITGWWFADQDSEHFDYWCDHSIPHILVLHEPDSGASHWVHIARERVESTGKGFKILVPAASRIDAAHRNALVDVATEKARMPTWEGRVWHGGGEIPVSARLRHALIVPRLVSPHPNRGYVDPDPYEALALLTQVRTADLDGLDKKGWLSDSQVADEAAPWEWQLFAALYKWLEDEQLDGLVNCLATARCVEQRVAAIACLAFARLERGEVTETIRLIESEMKRDEARPVDHGWLLAHLARCRLELGDRVAACEAALGVRRLGVEAGSDPTARALVAAASHTLLSASDIKDADIEGVVRDNDTASSWWRAQSLAAGLGRHFDESFEHWAGKDHRTVYTQDVTWNELRSATIVSGVSADHFSWASAASMLARRELMSAGHDAESCKQALERLRRSGDEKTLRRAVAKVYRDGPIFALTAIGGRLDLDGSTRASLRANLGFVESAADVLAPPDLSRHIRWALRVLSDLDGLEQVLCSMFPVDDAVLDMLAALMPRGDRQDRRYVIDHLVGLPAVDNPLTADRIGRLLSRIPNDEWLAENIEALGRRNTDGDRPEFRGALESVLARRHPEVRSGLIDRIRSGDLDALARYGNVTDLSAEVAAEAIERVAEAVEAQTESGRRGSHVLGGPDKLDALVILNLWHTDAARWSAVESALNASTSCPDHLKNAIRTLDRCAGKVPNDIRYRLREGLREIAARPAPETDGPYFVDDADIRGDAFVTWMSFFPNEQDDDTIRWMLAGTDMTLQCAAVRVMGRRMDGNDLGLLVLLARDQEDKVRQAAAEALAGWVARGIAMPGSAEVLEAVVKRSGALLGVAASCALMSRDIKAVPGDPLVELLRDHPSALARARVAAALEEHKS